MARVALWTGLLAALLAGGTFWGGWWALPGIALLWGAMGQGRFPGLLGALAGALAWSGLLIVAASRADVGQVATITGGVLGVPPFATYAITVGFAAGLAGSAATLGRTLRRVVVRLARRTDPAPS